MLGQMAVEASRLHRANTLDAGDDDAGDDGDDDGHGAAAVTRDDAALRDSGNDARLSSSGRAKARNAK